MRVEGFRITCISSFNADPVRSSDEHMKILYTGSDVGFEAAAGAVGGRADVVHGQATADDVARELKTSDALLDASMKVPITDEMVRTAPLLKIISCATTGCDHIERTELDRRDIPVRTLREDRELLHNLTPAAEHSWALLMACARKLPAALEHVKAGGWERELFPGVMLRGRRMGIIGCGRIGLWVARYARAFAMDIVGHDPYVESLPEYIVPLSLEELVQTSDFISIHVHLTGETKGLMSKELFAQMKPGAIFVNTSRAAVASQAGLLDALESGRLRAAGLDVLEGEPDIDGNPLVAYARKYDNLIVSPHCGGFSPDAVALVCRHAAGKILQHLDLGP